MAGRGKPRTTVSSNLVGDTSRRRPPLAHERERDTSPLSGDRTEGWKSLVDGRKSPMNNRRFPGKDHRYSLDDDRSPFEDKKSTLNEKRTSYSDTPSYSDKRTTYEFNDKRTSYNEKKSLYSKDSDEEKRSSYDKKTTYDNKRNSYEKSSYDGDRYSLNEKELTDKRASYEKKSLYDKDSGDAVSLEKKLYDGRKSSFKDKKGNTERYNDRNVFDSKRPLYSEKKSLYDDFDKPTKANERQSPVDWKSHSKDRKSFIGIDKQAHDRKSSDEDWDLSDDIKRPPRKSPIQGRKPTIDIWRPKVNRVTSSGDRKVSDDEWDSPVHKVTEGPKSYSEQRKFGSSKDPVEDWDSPVTSIPSQRTSNRKSFGEQRKSTSDRNANDEDWNPPHQRLSYYRKSDGDQRKAPEERKLSDDEWDSSTHSRGIKKSNEERNGSEETWRSSSRNADEKLSSTLLNRRGDGDRKSPSSQRKSSDEEWDYSHSYKSSFNDGKSSFRDRKSTTDMRKSSSSQKSYQDDTEWNSPVHRRSFNDKKSYDERKSFVTESDEEQKSSARHRLSGNDRKYLPDISHILEMVDKVKLHKLELMSEMLNEVEKEIRHCLSHPEYTRVLVMKMYDRCKEDQEFATRAGALFGMIHNLKFGDLSVKAVLLRCVQHDLEEKQHERGEENQILNSIFFLSELYHHIRINNLPVSILGEALLKHLEPLLLGEESDLELLATCLIVNGSVLLQDQPLKFSKLTMKIRTVLIKETLSTKCRGWLLLIIEFSSRDFAPLLPETCKWYRSLLGSTTFEKFERLKPLPAVPL